MAALGCGSYDTEAHPQREGGRFPDGGAESGRSSSGSATRSTEQSSGSSSGGSSSTGGWSTSDSPEYPDYHESGVITGVAAHGDRVITIGPPAALWDATAGGLIASAEALPGGGLSAAFTADGRWVLGQHGQLRIERDVTILLDVGPLTTDAIYTRDEALIPVPSSHVVIVGFESGDSMWHALPRPALLPMAIARWSGSLVVAGAEWARAALRADDTWQELPVHNLFSESEVLDPVAWVPEPPRRHLVPWQNALAEVVSVRTQTRLVVHGSPVVAASLDMTGSCTGVTVAGELLLLLTVDKTSLMTWLTGVRISGDTPTQAWQQSFSGRGLGLATTGDRVYVVDAERGVRILQLTQEAPVFLGTHPISP
ncbi:MAG: hypothetical protein AB2A00_21135 [Myxococcota bacterium]